MTRKSIQSYGSHGAQVHVYTEDGKVYVEWRDNAKKRHQKSYPLAKIEDCKRWAMGYAAERERLAKVSGPIPTIPELWVKYRTARGPGWRAKTPRNYADWAKMLGAIIAKPIDQIGHDDADVVRDTLRARGIAHGTIRRAIGFLRQILTFAVGRRIIVANPVASYRYETPKSERTEPPAEYTREEITKIIAALDHPSEWRARDVVRLCASYGARVNAILHLRREDVNFDAGTVTFQGKWDKNGETFTRPMTTVARQALLEACNHAHASGWVFWSPRDPTHPIRYNAVHYHLLKAEKRAGVQHIKRRAFHGERRMVIGDIGDLAGAGQWVNQRTLAVTAGYMRDRPERLDEAKRKLEQSGG